MYDGNLALIDSDGKIQWMSLDNHGKVGYNFPNCVCMQDDSNIVVYDGNANALWSQWWNVMPANTTATNAFRSAQESVQI